MTSHVRLLSITTFVAAIATLSAGASDAQDAVTSSHADSVAIAKTVEDFHNALSSGDSAKALSILSNDAVILESGGLESLSQYRSHHLPADISFAKAVASTRAPIQVRVEGSSAWTVGTSTTKGTFKGKAIDSIGAESMVLTKQPGGWRIRSIHWSSRKRTTAP
jgi:ketosteroid isomerase-like protein